MNLPSPGWNKFSGPLAATNQTVTLVWGKFGPLLVLLSRALFHKSVYILCGKHQSDPHVSSFHTSHEGQTCAVSLTVETCSFTVAGVSCGACDDISGLFPTSFSILWSGRGGTYLDSQPWEVFWICSNRRLLSRQQNDQLQIPFKNHLVVSDGLCTTLAVLRGNNCEGVLIYCSS